MDSIYSSLTQKNPNIHSFVPLFSYFPVSITLLYYLHFLFPISYLNLSKFYTPYLNPPGEGLSI
jgi:hypothetical protein